MVLYRRNRVVGGCYFFTVNLCDRKSDFLVRYVDCLRESFSDAQHKSFFTIDAIVILPEHLHAILSLPEGDDDFSSRWRLVKSNFTKKLKHQNVSLFVNDRGEYNLWQKRFWEHTIQDEEDYSRHVDYIHYNPVKHGYAKQVVDWPYSSFHKFVKKGILTPDWSSNKPEPDATKFGEM